MQRRLIAYPHPKYYKMTVADAFKNGESKSEKLENIVKQHYDNLSTNEQKTLLSDYDKLSEQERKRPKNHF